MKQTADVTCAVIDSGLFLPVALRLAEDFKRVIFCQPSEKTPCSVRSACIGDGFERIELVRDVWPHVKEIDLFVFPDVHHAPMQLHLEGLGKAVWGTKTADVLELNRSMFMDMVEQLGLDVPTYADVRGIDKLREHLRDKEDKYLKVSRYRGDMETFHWRSYEQDSCWLDSMAVWLGPLQNKIKFLIFDAIDTDIELGGDGYCIDGKWPETMLNGLEWKDKSYFGAVTDRKDMPEQTLHVIEAFSPILAQKKYRQFWSMEVRVKDDKAYFIDATVRAGLPSSGSQQLLWKNYSEIVWAGANGAVVNPDPAAKFSIETMVSVKPEGDCWDVVPVPEELRRNCRFANCAFIDGAYCFPPEQLRGGDLGWMVATGNSPKDCLDEIKRLADSLPDGCDAKVEDLAGVLKEIDSAHEKGISITDAKVPAPAAAIE